MGEIAEMMLDGTLCECCGASFDDRQSPGFPRYCSRQCAEDRGAVEPAAPKVKCEMCGKKVKAVGIEQHMKDKHNVVQGEAV